MILKTRLWLAQHKTNVYKFLIIFLLIVVIAISIIYFTYSKFTNKFEATMYETTVEPFFNNDYFIASYIDGESSDTIPIKSDGYIVEKIECNNDAIGTWDNDKWGLLITNATQKTKCSVYFNIQKVQTYSYTGTEQVFKCLKTGKYKIELWGAGINARGGYTSGIIELRKGINLYIYVGNASAVSSGSCYDSINNAAYNGSKVGSCWGGGGATDVRLTSTNNWYDFDGLKSRIMVAAGAGSIAYTGKGASAGGLIGYSGGGGTSPGSGGTQTSGSAFGIAGKNTTIGGNGYYGGYGGGAADSGGGSSFISGHDGCNAIKEESTASSIIHTGQSIHYSGMYFTDTVMVDGAGYSWTNVKGTYTGMPTHDGTSTMSGNLGNGYAKITYVE